MSIVEERYSKWLNHENLAPQYKPVLEAMNAEEKNAAFYTTIEFGTAGMRGLLGPGTNRINIHTIRKATQGYANYINENNGGEAGIAIGYDNRHMSKEFAFDCADLLAKNNIKSYVFESLRPTPELSFAVRHLNCFGGIMITASHNPKEYNGYKLYDDKGCQLIPCLASQVTDKVNAIEDELAIDANCTEEQKKLITVIGKDVDEEYYKNVFLMTAGGTYAFNDSWKLNVAIHNLLDKKFTDSFAGNPTDGYVSQYNRIEEGRRFWVSLTGNF